MNVTLKFVPMCQQVQSRLDPIGESSSSNSNGGLWSSLPEVIRNDKLLTDSDAADGSWDRERRLEAAVDANVRATMDQLRTESTLLGDMEREGEIEIVGARYDLGSGRVTILPDDDSP